MGIMLVWYLFFLPKTTPETPDPAKTQSTQHAKVDTIAPAVVINDTLQGKKMADMYGDLSVASQGENKTLTLKTEKLTVTIHTKGGKIANAALNAHKNYNGKAMSMVADMPPARPGQLVECGSLKSQLCSWFLMACG